VLTVLPHEEVRNMKCASCGEIIKGDPVWRDEKPYCSEECADIGPFDEEEEEEEK
jgi:endogenous inhibitor of DNA gyrase (YacG/DUF329 family)